MKKIIIIAVIAIPLALIIYFLWPKPEPVKEVVLIEQSAYIPPPPAAKQKSPVTFTDVTAATGIDFQHFNGASVDAQGKPTRYMPETMGPGVALLDYDQDGDLDIMVTNSSSFDGNYNDSMRPGLFENQGDFVFKDVSERLGDNTISYWMGVTVADYNGDTYPDLLLTGWNRMALLQNQQGKGFRDVTAAVIPAANDPARQRWSTGAVFFDVDNDHDLDLFVAEYVDWSPQTDLFATMDGQHKSYATPNIYQGGSSRLFLQQDGVFNDSTETSGMLNDDGKSLGVALWDFDKNGLLDIVVANDTQPNFLYYNLGGGQFENRALEAGIAYDANGRTRAGMGIDVGDLGNDNHACIAIGNFSREPLSLFRDEGDGFFREGSQGFGVAETTYLSLTFGVSFADFDLDGWQDIILVNGHIEPEISNVEEKITYKQTLQLLGNTGAARFVDWSPSAGDAFTKPIAGRGLATGDLDGDGDVDIVATENNGKLYVFSNNNEANNQFLRVKLTGQNPNTNAIGASISLLTDDGLTQQRLVKGGSSYLSQSELIQTFGVKAGVAATKLIIKWPAGNTVDYPVTELNKTIVIQENSGQIAYLD